MMFNYSAKKLISYDESKASRKLKDNFEAFMYGLISFPLNIPGTTYHACLKVIILIIGTFFPFYTHYLISKKISIIEKKNLEPYIWK